MAGPLSLIRKTLVVTLLVGSAAVGALAAAEPSAGRTLSSPQVPFQSMTGEKLFAKLLEHNRIRDLRLHEYSAVRTYEVTNDKGKVYAEQTVRMQYQAPDRKTFVTDSAKGSKLVRDLVLNRLIESESETSSGRAHRDSSIKPANYEFELLGEEDLGPYHCLVVEAMPRRKDKHLFEGKVWIDTEDCAIVRIAGHPAKSISFWITRAEFVRQYQKIGEFWLPARDETFVHVRLYGNKVLTIDHQGYMINCAADAGAEDLAAEKGLQRTAIQAVQTGKWGNVEAFRGNPK